MRKKSKRGGARTGAGRKSTGNVQWVIRTKPETRTRLKALAKEQETTPGGVIDSLV